MPSPHRYPHQTVLVELELTPVWWMELTRNLTAQPEAAPVRALYAAACAIALSVNEVASFKVEHSKLIACVRIPQDASLARICERAGDAIDRLQRLDISCLNLPARAKFLT